MKNILIATIASTLLPLSVGATEYNDTVTFSASAVCSELTGLKYPSKASDAEWKTYLTCIETLHYFNTKY
jgi:hypothetical protein